jgi:2-dehydro-3-deoxygluconokinase
MTRVLCIGECMVELSHIDARTLQLGFAGDTYNTAVYLTRVAGELGLDVEVGYLTGLGTDEYSAAMREEWRAESIADRSLLVDDGLPGVYAIRTDQRGERHFSYWREQSAARRVFRGTDFCREIAGDFVHLSGITLQLTTGASRAALLARLQELRATGTRVSFDTNYRPRGWPSPSDAMDAIDELCRVADIVLASRDDEVLLRGHGTPEELIAVLSELGAAEVVLRDGPRGAYVHSADGTAHVAAQAVDRIVDTTAAGDAFAGAYLAARLGSENLEAAAALGNRVAATTIQHPGALTPRDLRLTNAHPLAIKEHQT